MKRFAGMCAVSAACMAIVGPASAQDAMFSTLASDTANNIRNTSIRDSMLGVDSMRSRRGGPVVSRSPMALGRGYGPVPGGRPVRASPDATRFRPDPAVTARVQRQFIDFVAKRSGAAGGDAMARAFASQNLLESWAAQAAPDGMRLGDVADAMAEYWVTNWLIARGAMNAPPGTVRAVRDQVRATMAANPAFQRLGDAQRQEMAEVLIYNTLLQGEVFGDAMKRRDTVLVSRAGDAAVARFRNEMGVDLRSLALTDQGFLKRG